MADATSADSNVATTDEDAAAQEMLAEAATTDPDDEGAEQLGDPGKKALDRMKERWKAERDRRKQLEQQIAESSKPGDAGDDVDVEAIRKQAREEAAAEALRDRVLDKIEAKARKFVDPEDTAAILLRSHSVDDFIDGGKVDAAAITEALEELAEVKPHLVAKPQPSSGGFDSGRGRKGYKGQLEKADLSGMTPEQINAARKEGRLDRLMGKAV